MVPGTIPLDFSTPLEELEEPGEDAVAADLELSEDE